MEISWTEIIRANAGAVLFSFALAFFSFSYYIGSVNATNVFGISLAVLSLVLELCALAFLLLKLLLQKTSHVKVLVGLLLVLICVGSLKSNKAPQIIWLALFCLCTEDVPESYISRPILVSSVFMLLMVVGLNSVGVIPSVLMSRGSNFVRNSMGFAHPNNFGQLLFIAYSASIFELKGRSGLAGIFCFAIAFFVADSKTSAAGIFAMALYSVISFRSPRSKPYGPLFTFLPLILAIVSIALPLMWSHGANKWLVQLDNLMTNRVFYSAYYFENYPLTVFGNDLTAIVSLPSATGGYLIQTRVMLDNAYCRLLVQYGLIPLTAFVAFYCVVINKARISAHVTFMGLVLYSLMGFVECGMLYLACNFFMLMALSAFSDKGSCQSGAPSKDVVEMAK